MRPAPIFTNGYYHIYNRGVDKRKIFLRYGHYMRFTRTIENIINLGSATPRPLKIQPQGLIPKIEILAYCLMPNHYHFLIKQTENNGITDFMSQLSNSYTKFFNTNTKRTGRLFEDIYKAKNINSDEILLHISRYIHLNPLLAKIVQNIEFYPWSSYLAYMNLKKCTFIKKSEIMSHFSTESQYNNFILKQSEYSFLLKEIENGVDENDLFL